MNKQDTTTVRRAVAALTATARKVFPRVEGHSKAAGFEIAGYEPPHGTPDLDAAAGADIGEVIAGRGIYHGSWQPYLNGVMVHAYSDTDLLKDVSGELMLLKWHEARDELARRNNGRCYGDGTEAVLRHALAKPSGAHGAYKDGDLVMAPQLLLNGRDADGEKVRVQNTVDLLRESKGNAFQNISKALRSGSDFGRWSWSCTEDRDFPYVARAVRLSDGYVDWGYEVNFALGVLPFRVFREPHAVKAVSHLTR